MRLLLYSLPSSIGLRIGTYEDEERLRGELYVVGSSSMTFLMLCHKQGTQ